MAQILQWLSAHFLWVVLFVSTLLSWNWLLYFRKRLAIGGLMALLLSAAHTIIGVLAVKAFAFLEGVPGGMSLYGAIFFLPLIYALGAKLSKRSTREVFDAFTICIILAFLLARCNCLRSGCCLGAVVPWSDSVRWPTRETELIFHLVLVIWLGRRVLQNKTHGTAYPLYMMCYGGFRFLLEFLRDNQALCGPFHIAHIWSVVSIVAGALAYSHIVRAAKGAANQKSKRGRKGSLHEKT